MVDKSRGVEYIGEVANTHRGYIEEKV